MPLNTASINNPIFTYHIVNIKESACQQRLNGLIEFTYHIVNIKDYIV